MSESQDSGIVSGDIYLKYRRPYGEAVSAQQQKGSLVQQAVKAAESAGVNVRAMKAVRSLQRMEPAIAAANIRDQLAYLAYEKSPALLQSDLHYNGKSLLDYLQPLLQAVGAAPPSQEAAEEFTDSQAEEIGYQRGYKGGDLDSINDQFQPGTSANVAAARGFKKGQEFMQAKTGAKPVTASPGRRGAKAAAAPAPKAEKPPTKREIKAAAKAEAFAAAQAKNAAKVVPIKRGEGDSDFDRPRATVPGPDGVNLIAAQSMSAAAMVEYYNSFNPPKTKLKFESRAAGIKALTDLYNAQRNGKHAIEDAAGAAAVGPIGTAPTPELAAAGDGWPVVASREPDFGDLEPELENEDADPAE